MSSPRSASSVAPPLLGVQTPRISSFPDYVSTSGQEAIELAALAGLGLDPWEALVLTHALGERIDGKWAAFEVGLVVPRQNGKGSILEARELAGPILFGEKLLIHSAHEQATSSEHFLRLLGLFEEAELSSRMRKPIRGKGSEAILFKNGARILFKTRTGGGGRGLTGDFVGLDEAMILPEATTAALVPTMAARSIHGNPQLWYTGSAVDRATNDHGVVLARVRERGIAGDPRLAYFEWSAEGENPDEVKPNALADIDNWARANPGLGIRISLEHVANEHRGALGRRAFAVERLGIGDWPPTEETAEKVIDIEAWRDLEDAGSKIASRRSFVWDVTPDRSRSAIAVCGHRADDLRHIEVIEHKRGTSWVEDRVVELVERWDPVAVGCEAGSPAASLLPAIEARLESKPVEVIPISAAENAQACGMLIDAVTDRTVQHLGTTELENAIQGAVKQPLGEAWKWSRKHSGVDISPLVCVTLAHWATVTHPDKPKAKPAAIWR